MKEVDARGSDAGSAVGGVGGGQSRGVKISSARANGNVIAAASQPGRNRSLEHEDGEF